MNYTTSAMMNGSSTNETWQQYPTDYPTPEVAMDLHQNESALSPEGLDEILNMTYIEDQLRVSEETRVASLVLMSMSIGLAFGLAVWVCWHYQSPVVKAMQPLFLLLLCLGSIISNLSIIPLGAQINNDSMMADSACVTTAWLEAMGPTIFYASLISKLWRVNRIFRARGFQKKAVTIKDVLKPVLILLPLNSILLILLTTLDPPQWKLLEYDEEEKDFEFSGVCMSETWVGNLIEFLLGLIQFVVLILLCVQAYRARDIQTQFSEARGVALALFSSLQVQILAAAMLFLINEYNLNAFYMLDVLPEVMNSIAMLLFIFCPIISHHRARARGDTPSVTAGPSSTFHSPRPSGGGMTPVGVGTRISGLDYATPPPPAGRLQFPTAGNAAELHQAQCKITELQDELQAMRSRIRELEQREQENKQKHAQHDCPQAMEETQQRQQRLEVQVDEEQPNDDVATP